MMKRRRRLISFCRPLESEAWYNTLMKQVSFSYKNTEADVSLSASFPEDGSVITKLKAFVALLEQAKIEVEGEVASRENEIIKGIRSTPHGIA